MENEIETDELLENQYSTHEPEEGSLKYAAPELFAATTIANAYASGSTKARNKAKIMAWVIIFGFVGIPVLAIVFSELF